MDKGKSALLLCLLLCAALLPLRALAISGAQVAQDGTYQSSGTVTQIDDDDYTFRLTLVVRDGAVYSITQQDTIAEDADDSYYCHEQAFRFIRGLVGKSASLDTVDANAPEAAAPAVKYTVSFDWNGAPDDGRAPGRYGAGETVTVADPAWAGHRFDGWTGAEVKDGTFTMPEKDVTLRAEWTTVVSAQPGDHSVLAGDARYQIAADFSGVDLQTGTPYQAFFAVYNAAGRMLRLETREVAFTGGAFQISFDVENPEVRWTGKLFLLEGAALRPLCGPVQVRFLPAVEDGTYSGSALCRTGNLNYLVDVDVTVQDGRITEVEDRTLRTPLSSRDRELYAQAWTGMREKLLARVEDVSGVDAVSGATVSSRGIRAAVTDALEGRRSAAEPEGTRYAPEGISLYVKQYPAYPIATVTDNRITDIRIVGRDPVDARLAAFAGEIIRTQSVRLPYPEEIADDAFLMANLIDQILYGKGVLQ